MIMTRGSKTQCERRATSSAMDRRAGQGRQIERANFVCRSAGIWGLALGLACLLAITSQVRAQTMSGSTMTAPGTAYPPSAGSPAGSMGAPPLAPETVRPPHLVHLQPAVLQPHHALGQAQGLADRQAAITRRSGDAAGDQRAGAYLADPDIVLHQWSLTSEVPGENIFSDEYMRTRDSNTRSISLKETLYLALKNNPAVAAASLDPVISLQGVRGSWAVFDPDLTGQTGVQKLVTPTTSSLQTGGAESFIREGIHLELRHQQNAGHHQRHAWSELHQQLFLDQFGIRFGESGLYTGHRAFAQPAAAAQLRQPVRHHQCANRRIKPESSAVQLRAATQ